MTDAVRPQPVSARLPSCVHSTDGRYGVQYESAAVMPFGPQIGRQARSSGHGGAHRAR
ncbi:hypothetical protein [Nocardia sp. CA-119907]|uniref:hypothetical protein n=1 Tax=Nocardia sp. CA-119907 TaxID=3239973 RepID=UPI003D99AAE1